MSRLFLSIALLIGTSVGPVHAGVDKIGVYVWVDSEGNKHFTDDAKKAPKGSAKRTVITPRPRPVVVQWASNRPQKGTLPPIPMDAAPPPTSLPPASLPPLPGDIAIP